jgi:uncharacterized protein YaiI (UPF0178 family)
VCLKLDIFIDADGCPVKQEVYRVARRYGLKVTLVSNSWMRTPHEDWIELVVVDGQPDAADDWIVERVSERDIVFLQRLDEMAQTVFRRKEVQDGR